MTRLFGFLSPSVPLSYSSSVVAMISIELLLSSSIRNRFVWPAINLNHLPSSYILFTFAAGIFGSIWNSLVDILDALMQNFASYFHASSNIFFFVSSP